MLQSALQLSEFGNRDSRSTGRIFLLGNLRNRGNAGLRYVNGNNDLANARWNYGSRQSGTTLSTSFSIRDYPPSFWDETGIGLA